MVAGDLHYIGVLLVEHSQRADVGLGVREMVFRESSRALKLDGLPARPAVSGRAGTGKLQAGFCARVLRVRALDGSQQRSRWGWHPEGTRGSRVRDHILPTKQRAEFLLWASPRPRAEDHWPVRSVPHASCFSHAQPRGAETLGGDF